MVVRIISVYQFAILVSLLKSFQFESRTNNNDAVCGDWKQCYNVPICCCCFDNDYYLEDQFNFYSISQESSPGPMNMVTERNFCIVMAISVHSHFSISVHFKSLECPRPLAGCVRVVRRANKFTACWNCVLNSMTPFSSSLLLWLLLLLLLPSTQHRNGQPLSNPIVISECGFVGQPHRRGHLKFAFIVAIVLRQ